MKNITKKLSAGLFVALFAVVAVLAPLTTVSAQNTLNSGVGSASGDSSVDADTHTASDWNTNSGLFSNDGIFTNIINTFLFVIGALSVVMLIYGGIRYTTSGGNANSVTAAKNTIMYAIIGLVVAFIAFAVVNWVLASL